MRETVERKIGLETIELKPKGLRRLEGGHPWVFASDLQSSHAPSAPGIALAVDARGHRVGQGLYNPRSKLAFRFLTTQTEPVDESFFASRVARACAYRERVTAGYEAFRVVHSEGDGLPGLTVDKYADVLVVQVHAAGLEPFVPAILETLHAHYRPKGVLARNDSPVRALEGLPQEVTVLYGSVPERVPYREGLVTLFAAPYTGQKTGAFLDQRENHVYAGSLARGRCLDVFSYHGGFALQLASAPHTEVLAVDSSAAALAQVEAGAARNGLGLRTHKGDAFEVLRSLAEARERFDTIVLDPPAFAKGRSNVARALTGYKEINLRAMTLLGPGGRLFTASCSHHVSEPDFYAMLTEAAADAGVRMRVLERRGAALCHPERLGVPETRYLKFAALELEE